MNDVTLKEHLERIVADQGRRFDERFVALEERLLERWQSQQHSLEVAFAAQKEVNFKQNEFRGALDDAAKRAERDMLPRREYETRHDAMVRELDESRKEAVRDLAALREESRRERGILHETIAAMRLESEKTNAELRDHHEKDVSTLRQEMIERPRASSERRAARAIAAIAAIAGVLVVVISLVSAIHVL